MPLRLENAKLCKLASPTDVFDPNPSPIIVYPLPRTKQLNPHSPTMFAVDSQENCGELCQYYFCGTYNKAVFDFNHEVLDFFLLLLLWEHSLR